MNIGLYFGSFNPIHIGHLIIANHVVNFSDINQVWLVISPQNPLKPSNTLLNEYHRLHLVQKAIEDNPKLKASDVEFRLPKPSYTIDTLLFLKEKYPKHKFSVVMDSDSYQNINNWKEAEKLKKDYSFIIYERHDFIIDKINIEKEKVIVLKAPLLEISATTIRNNIKSGKSIKYLVPEVVDKEIVENGYYKI